MDDAASSDPDQATTDSGPPDSATPPDSGPPPTELCEDTDQARFAGDVVIGVGCTLSAGHGVVIEGRLIGEGIGSSSILIPPGSPGIVLGHGASLEDARKGRWFLVADDLAHRVFIDKKDPHP